MHEIIANEHYKTPNITCKQFNHALLLNFQEYSITNHLSMFLDEILLYISCKKISCFLVQF